MLENTEKEITQMHLMEKLKLRIFLRQFF